MVNVSLKKFVLIIESLSMFVKTVDSIEVMSSFSPVMFSLTDKSVTDKSIKLVKSVKPIWVNALLTGELTEVMNICSSVISSVPRLT